MRSGPGGILVAALMLAALCARSAQAAPGPVLPPDVTATSPSSTGVTLADGTAQTFSVTATDPQSLPLTYDWSLDGAATGTTTSSYDYVASGVGTHDVTVTVDNGQASTQVTWSVQVTAVPPVVTIESPTGASGLLTAADTVDLSGTASALHGVTNVAWASDAGGSGTAQGTTSWSVAGVGLQAGVNVLTVTATDGLGQTASAVLNVFRDTQDPSALITSPTSGATWVTTSASLTLAGDASDDSGVTQVTWSDDRGGSGTASGTASWSVGPLTLAAGRTRFAVVPHDGVGNTNTEFLDVDYDTAPPAIAVTSPTAADSFDTGLYSLTVDGTASDDIGVASVTWSNERTGGSGTASGTTSWSSGPIGFEPGTNVLTFTVTDVAGGTATDFLTVNVDAAPDVSITIPATGASYTASGPSVVVSGLASDDLGVAGVDWSNDRGGSGTASGTTAWTIGSAAFDPGIRLPSPAAGAGDWGWWNGAPASQGQPPSLMPGTGFTGATTEPSASGTGTGSDAKAIARWDVVPFQTFTGTMTAGVIAFHATGIDRVEFSADGGAWVAVDAPSYNAGSGVWEYCVSLDAADFADGAVEVRAIAYPNVGIPRVLQGTLTDSQGTRNGNHSLFLSANHGGTLPAVSYYVSPTLGNDDSQTAGTQSDPFATPSYALLQAGLVNSSNDGTTIYLMAGRYRWGDGIYQTADAQQRWVTFKPAPGVARSDVIFDSTGFGFGSTLQCLENVTIEGLVYLNLSQTFLLMKDVVWVGPGADVDSYLMNSAWPAMAWAVGCEASQSSHGLAGFTVQSNCYVHDTSFGAFQSATMTVNCRVSDYAFVQGVHADVWHWFPVESDLDPAKLLENVVLYGVRVWNFDNQAIFAEVSPTGSRMDNVAIVDVRVFKNAATSSGSWWNVSTNHLLMWNLLLPDQLMRWDQQANGTTLENVSIIGSMFQAFQFDLPANAHVDHVHYTEPNRYAATYPGTNVTTGGEAPTLFVDAANGDFTPAAAPLALSPGRNVLTVVAHDSPGQTGTATLTIDYDADPPSITVTGPSAADSFEIRAASVVVDGTASDDLGLATVTWTNDRGGAGSAAGTTAWSSGAIALLPGPNVLTFTATDTAGRTATDVATVYSDVTDPAVAITVPAASGVHLTTSASLAMSGTAADDAGLAGVTWSNDRGGSGTAAGTTAWSVDAVALLPGRNVITVVVSDLMGHTGTTSLAVDYDAAAPTIAVTGPSAADSFEIRAAAIVVAGTASDDIALATVTWTNDRGGAGSAAGTTAWSSGAIALSPGPNVLTFTATDTAGRTAIDVATVYSDVTDPAVAITVPAASGVHLTTSASLAMSGTAADDAGLAGVTWSNDRGGSGTAAGTTAWSVDSVALLPGRNVITVVVSDLMGHTGTTSLAVDYDAAAPTIAVTGPSAADSFEIRAAAIVVAGTASDDIALATVTWTNDRGGAGSAAGTTAWSSGAIALLPGPNVLIFTATDTAGRTATDVATVYSDVTDPAVAITVPAASGVHLTTSASLAMSGTAADDAGLAGVTWSNDRGGSGTAAGTTAWSVDSVALLPGRNVITVVVSDLMGHTGTTALAVDYDAAAPAIAVTGPSAADSFEIRAAAIVVAGTASDDIALATVTWTNDRGGAGSATGTTAWSSGAIALLPGPNVLTFTATDTAGRTATDVATVYSDVTDPAVVITSPAASGVHLTTSASLAMSGTAADDAGLAGVTWSNDRGGSGTAAGTMAWSVDSVALLPGRNVITVVVSDLMGHTGTTTLAVDYDAAAPAIAVTGPSAADSFEIRAAAIVVAGTASDDIALATVTWTNDRGGAGSAAGTTAWSSGAIALLPGPNVLTFTATDTAGRTATDVATVYSDVTDPAVAITVPAASGVHLTTSASLAMSGTAADDAGLAGVTWSNDRGGSGTAAGTTAWSVDSVALLPGRNVITVVVSDLMGHTGTTTLAVDYDAAAPAIAVTGPSAADSFEIRAASVVVDGTASDDLGLATVTWTNDRGGAGSAAGTTAWSSGAIALLPGPNVLTFTATDTAGRTATDVATVYSDVTDPAVAITVPAASGVHLTTSASLAMSGTAADDAGLAGVTWSNDRGGSGTAAGTMAWSVDSVALLPGRNVITVVVSDLMGHTGTTSLAVDYDAAAPAIAVTGPSAADSFEIRAAAIVVAGTASDDIALATVTWTNDRGGAGSATGTTAWSSGAIALLPGPNVLTFTATDTAGRTATDVATVYSDVTDPAVVITSPAASGVHLTTSASLAMSGTASDDAGLAGVTWSNDRGGSGTAAGTTAWSVDSVALLPGRNVITVVVSDLMGHTGTTSLAVDYDAAAPAIAVTGPSAADSFEIRAAAIVVAGTASDDIALATVTWTNDRGGAGSAAGTTAWSSGAIALLPGPNVLTFTATDTAGRTATDVATVYSDVTDPAVVITVPAASGVHLTTSASLAMSGTAADDAGLAGVTWSNDRGGSGTAAGTTAWSVDAVALLPGRNVITVVVSDLMGHTGTTSLAVDYDAVAPTIAVTIPTSAGSVETGAASIAVGGSAGDDLHVASVAWANDRGGSGTATGTTSWLVAAIGLQPGVNVLTFTVTDDAGRTGTAQLQVTQDVQIPTVTITGPTAGVTYVSTAASIALSGIAADDIGVTAVFWSNDRGGGGTATGTTSWSVDSAALLPGRNVITVLARDGQGREGFDVLAVDYDAAAPAIAVTSPTAASSIDTGASSLVVAGTASDDLLVVSVTWSNDRGGAGTAAGTTSWSSGPIALASGTNVLTFTATDAAGRTTTGVLTAFRDDVAPTVTITSPAAAPAFVTSRPLLAFAGSAGDNRGVASVAWASDRGGSGTASGAAAWSASVPVLPGTNVVTVTATDLHGNSASATIAIDYRPVFLSLAAGFNLVSLPAVPDGPVTASSLLAAINVTGGSAIAVVDLGADEPLVRLVTGAGSDFSIAGGRSYFVLAGGPSQMQVIGDALSVATVRIALRSGLNFVALPVTPAGPRTASAVAAEVVAGGGGVVAISRWKDGALEPHLPGRTMNDFAVTPGEGFVLLCDRASDWDVAP